MKFPSMNGQGTARIGVPPLSGGLNQSLPATAIADNELSDMKNLWFRQGALRTRPGLRTTQQKITVLKEEGESNSSITGYTIRMAAQGTYIDHTAGRRYAATLTTEERAQGGFEDPAGSTTITTETYAVGLAGLDGSAQEIVTGTKTTTVYSDMANPITLKSGRQYTLVVDGCRPFRILGKAVRGGLVFSEEGLAVLPEEADAEDALLPLTTDDMYIPTVRLNGTGRETGESGVAPDGVFFEEFNLLTPAFKETFTTDGKAGYFTLSKRAPGAAITASYVTATGGTVTHALSAGQTIESHAGGDGLVMGYNGETGIVSLVGAPDATLRIPSSGFSGNLTITVVPPEDEESKEAARRIFGMRIAQWFGGDRGSTRGGTRLFLSGNREHPGLLCWSSLNNPLYFPENNYAYVGAPEQEVTALGRQGELLVIFKQREIWCSTYIEGSLSADETAKGNSAGVEASAAYFPLTPLHATIGCDCPDTVALCGNRLCWADSGGRVYMLVSSGQYSSRNVRLLSAPVQPVLHRWRKEKGEEALRDMSATVALDHYILLCPAAGEALLLCGESSAFRYYTSYSTDEKAQEALSWSLWSFPEGLTTAAVFGEGDEALVCGLWLCGGATGRAFFTLDGIEDVGSEVLYLPGSLTSADVKGGPVQAFLETKHFDFGTPEQLKAIHKAVLYFDPLSPDAMAATLPTARVSYITEQGTQTASYRPDQALLVQGNPVVLSPNVLRVRQFGLRVEWSGPAGIRGMTLTVRSMGEVR